MGRENVLDFYVITELQVSC